MTDSTVEKRLKMGDTATYIIRVQGYLEEIWSDRLGNMVINPELHEGEAPESQLIGKLKDQAELVGVINGLYEMRMPILSVELVGVEESP